MNAALVAYRTLVELARADGEVSDEERSLLERYRQALGLEKETADLTELEPTPGPTPSRSFSPEQSIHVLKMMIRVAHADGIFRDRERRRMEEVARRLGIGRVRYAEIVVGVESDTQRTRRTRRSYRKTLLALAVVLVVVAAVSIYLVRRSATTEEMGQLQQRLDAMTLEQAAHDEEIVRRSMEDSIGISSFKEIEARYGSSVLLLVLAYDVARDGQTVSHWSSGTGFFVSPDGLIVTNKHVVQPWKFSPDIAAQLAAGFEIVEESLRLAAWPAGANLITEQGEFDVDSGYYIRNGTLEIDRIAEDRIEVRAAELSDGSPYFGALHAMGDGDLAVLKAEVAEPVRPFALPRTLPGVEKLDPVMVLGFPRGIAILEGRKAELSAALGEVSKIESNIMITAPVVPGNSGGPVVDRRGRVVGVATLTPGLGLGICLGTARLLPLLPGAGELIDRASRSVQLGQVVEALAYLDLADLRDPSPEEQAEAQRLRVRLEQIEGQSPAPE